MILATTWGKQATLPPIASNVPLLVAKSRPGSAEAVDKHTPTPVNSANWFLT
jgi:hypothetical protein